MNDTEDGGTFADGDETGGPDFVDKPRSLLMRAVFRIAALLILGFILLAIWIVCFPRAGESAGTLELEEARKTCPIPLPDAATNIRYATYRFFASHETLVRFEAPPDVCRQHVHTVVADWKSNLLDPPTKEPRPLTKLTGSPPSLKSTRLEAPWFDIQNIKNGFHSGGITGIPEFWIDTDRNLFFYRSRS